MNKRIRKKIRKRDGFFRYRDWLSYSGEAVWDGDDLIIAVLNKRHKKILRAYRFTNVMPVSIPDIKPPDLADITIEDIHFANELYENEMVRQSLVQRFEQAFHEYVERKYHPVPVEDGHVYDMLKDWRDGILEDDPNTYQECPDALRKTFDGISHLIVPQIPM